jgi:hypothetical protein
VRSNRQRRPVKKLVHTREISMRTFDLGDHTVLVEGTLLDHQNRPKQNKTPQKPKLLHHMVIRLKVKGPGMLIEQAEALMPQHPREECPEVLPWIRNLEGLRIVPGFTMKVKKVIGGIRGCAHLTSLIISMGESAVQGYWAAYGEEKGDMNLRKQTVQAFVNTCYLWRENGPIVKSLRETLELENSSG